LDFTGWIVYSQSILAFLFSLRNFCRVPLSQSYSVPLSALTMRSPVDVLKEKKEKEKENDAQ
jgi:hypothetical protein